MSSLIQWKEACLHPFIDKAPCGEELRYHDDFIRLKEALEKLEGTDYTLISTLGCQLLNTTSKDARLAGYLCLAWLQLFDLSGLLAGLSLYKLLLDTYGPQLFPLNNRAKQAAIEWFKNPRFLGRLASLKPTEEEWHAIKTAIGSLNNAISTQWGETMPLIHTFDEWLDAQQLKPDSTIKKNPEPALAVTPSIDLEQQGDHLQQQLIDFWRGKHQWLMACQLARAWRWGALELPPAVQGKTFIAPLRKEAFLRLEKARTHQDALLLLDCVESLFLEPGGHFFIDRTYEKLCSIGQRIN